MRNALFICWLLAMTAGIGCKKEIPSHVNPVDPDVPPEPAVTVIAEGRVGFFSAALPPGGGGGFPSGYTLGEITWILNPPAKVSSIVFLNGVMDGSYKYKIVRVTGTLDSVASSLGYYLRINLLQAPQVL